MATRRVLIVEDEVLIALQLEEIVPKRAGGRSASEPVSRHGKVVD
jgi:hypothetical protein